MAPLSLNFKINRVLSGFTPYLKHHIMAPRTRQNLYLTPSPEPPVVGCWKISKRRDFYKALDKNGASKTFTAICTDVSISQPTGTRWKRLRENMGSQAIRTTRSNSTKLERPSKVTKQIYKDLVNSKKKLFEIRNLRGYD